MVIIHRILLLCVPQYILLIQYGALITTPIANLHVVSTWPVHPTAPGSAAWRPAHCVAPVLCIGADSPALALPTVCLAVVTPTPPSFTV